MIHLEGAFLGKGKCPVCGRRWQMDLRWIWLWDDKKKDFIFFHELCSWCLIVILAEAIQNNIPFEIKWVNNKRDLIEQAKIRKALNEK